VQSLEETRGRSPTEIAAARKERTRLSALTEKLRTELDEQQRHVLKVKGRLKKEKDHFCQKGPDNLTELLQNCLLPRMVRSPSPRSTLIRARRAARVLAIAQIRTLSPFRSPA
jgi:hypothetical protein